MEAPATVYSTRAALETDYGSSNFANCPVYIRSTYAGSYPIYHEVCLWYNNKEFCLAPNYWAGTIGTRDATAGTQTKIKLKADMEAALGITIADSSCHSSSGSADCPDGDFYCIVDFDGLVSCSSPIMGWSCFIYGDGDVVCG